VRRSFSVARKQAILVHNGLPGSRKQGPDAIAGDGKRGGIPRGPVLHKMDLARRSSGPAFCRAVSCFTLGKPIRRKSKNGGRGILPSF
jgi:hypothetical protein